MSEDFWKWGDPAKSFHLNHFPKLKSFLEERWKQQLKDDFKTPDLTQQVSESPFTEGDFRKTFPNLKSGQFSNSKESRIRYGFGKSYHDIIRIFTGMIPALPDFVLFPESENDMEHILQQASQNRIRIVPFSGGSNVTGAFEIRFPGKSCIVNLQRMKKSVEVDEISHTAVFETGIFGPELEKILNARGFTLGHFPQSFEYSTLGGWLATRSGGQESGQYGKIEDMVLGIRAITPAGIIDSKDFPRHASGIDTFRLFIGSEGTLGIITQAKLRIHRLPSNHRWVVALFKTFEEGTEAVRILLQQSIHPGILRLSDALETKLFSAMRSSEPRGLKKLIGSFLKSYLAAKGFREPCLLMMRFAIRNNADFAVTQAARHLLKSRSAFILPSATAGNWEEHRFTLPYLRDTLIEHRVLIDTFETVVYWKDVTGLYLKVKDSLQKSDFHERGGLLFCHMSHVYETGACLYFTMLAPMEQGNEEAQWVRYKKLVTDAIIESGGAVSHHHGVGKDHQQWYLKMLGDKERKLLQAIKKHLDPNGIMNPGKLFDEAG
ncbi:MAG TPA: FAD-binding oxidoreductase [Chitinophagales bacterium]|nr:FAD-binding oxidoreductase [Chitinophagales bacterium]